MKIEINTREKHIEVYDLMVIDEIKQIIEFISTNKSLDFDGWDLQIYLSENKPIIEVKK